MSKALPNTPQTIRETIKQAIFNPSESWPDEPFVNYLIHHCITDQLCHNLTRAVVEILLLEGNNYVINTGAKNLIREYKLNIEDYKDLLVTHQPNSRFTEEEFNECTIASLEDHQVQHLGVEAR